MIKNHSAQYFSLVYCANYNMYTFENLKIDKETDCHYSVSNNHNFDEIMIDTELSKNFRDDIVVDNIITTIELISILKHRDKCYKNSGILIVVKITILDNDEYYSYDLTIKEELDKSKKITEKYKINKALESFLKHKEKIVDGAIRNHKGEELTHEQYLLYGSIYKNKIFTL